MYIDPHTEFRYENDELQAKFTLFSLGAATLVATVWLLALLKLAHGVG